MTKAWPILAALLVGACQNPDPAAYHHSLAHPYQVSDSTVRAPLAGLEPERAAERAGQFAAERPNNGSSFIVVGPTDTANAVRIALLRAGVLPADIRLVPEGAPAEIIRTDRFAHVAGCQGEAGSKSRLGYLFNIEDGYSRDNSDSKLFGCSVRRNVVEMVDDPRTLTGIAPNQGRDGARAGQVYGNWVKGLHTGGRGEVTETGTTTSTLSGGGP